MVAHYRPNEWAGAHRFFNPMQCEVRAYWGPNGNYYSVGLCGGGNGLDNCFSHYYD